MTEQPQANGTQKSYWEYTSPLSLPEPGTQGVPADVPVQQDGVAAQPGQREESVGAWQTPAADEAAALSVHAPSSRPPSGAKPRSRGLLLVFVVITLLAVVGSASGLGLGSFSRKSGQAAAAPRATAGQVILAPPTAMPRVSASAKPTATAHATPSPTQAGVTPTAVARQEPTILAQDDFQRPNQLFWGTASDGSPWQGDANASPVFSIQDGTGRITGGRGFFNAILGPQMADEEVVSSGSASHLDVQNDNLGVVLRWKDNEDYYKAYVDGKSLILIKRVAGTVSRLGAVPFAIQDGATYMLRFQAKGAQLRARVWPSSAQEPVNWMVLATDNALQEGYGGLRVLVEPAVTVTVSTFRERSML